MLLLTACGFPLAPVGEHGTELRQPESTYREVLAGDTLYSISWESGRDHRDVARWNNISPPYVIKPGQRLRLYPPAGVEKPRPMEQKPASVPLKQSAAGAAAADRKNTESVKSTAPSRRATSAAAAATISWTWPATGKLLERYSANGPNKGIDIAGKKGQPILAAAAGQVVYQGGGLRGYGQLIIVKHNADFLSAYAHCDTIYVKEGNVIKQGQKIALMGSSGANQVMLHFEIRYRGAPVDPQDYLPKK
ncbi:MAG: peptidoglycan DD-metalloendopeptidase family protein [Sulfuricaulis sp.]|nr:peptidoglycan DD-metalloendopeptidase family protein [Sulfuricaulis sp.]